MRKIYDIKPTISFLPTSFAIWFMAFLV
jgi:hypothetical protein